MHSNSAKQTKSSSSTKSKKSAAAFRTISEVANELDVQQHVLRFWETKFNQVKPIKRSGGRRYYRSEDIEVLSSIRKLLYNEGYTIKGAQKVLKSHLKNVGTDNSKPLALNKFDKKSIDNLIPAEQKSVGIDDSSKILDLLRDCEKRLDEMISKSE